VLNLAALGSGDPFRQAHIRYSLRRLAAYEKTMEELKATWPNPRGRAAVDQIRLTEIDRDALDAQASWPTNPRPAANFPWPDIIGAARHNPRRIEVAIWAGDHLCGLCLGHPSRGPHNVTLKLIEGRHGEHPLKGAIALIATICGEQWAILGRRQWLKIRNPHPPLIPMYVGLGFLLAGTFRGATYYARRVGSHDHARDTSPLTVRSRKRCAA
jgi:hypothetical protein